MAPRRAHLPLAFLPASLTLLWGGACLRSVPPAGPDEAPLALAAQDSPGSCNGLAPTIVADSLSPGAVVGTPGNDVIVGTPGADSIHAGGGNDTVCGLAGDDWIDGEDGNDAVRGGGGHDRLVGGNGDDTLDDTEGNDTLDGGAGNDLLLGSKGNDELLGGDGVDNLRGEVGSDYLDGGWGSDVLDGGRDSDVCVAGGDQLTRCEVIEEPPPPDPELPNFLIIITDDQRYDSYVDFMPITHARIAQQGVEFTRGYVTTPLCCPSRSSILTGMYARNHGVITNGGNPLYPTLVQRINEAGYFTGLVGKYLNACCVTQPSEFDFWVSGSTAYTDPTLNVNGASTPHTGYSTHILRDYALQFLDAELAADRPFLLLFAPTAPHLPSTPAPEDVGRHAGVPLHRPPSFNEADISDKPAWVQKGLLSPSKVAYLDAERQRMLETLWSVDLAIGAILDKLEAQGQLDETFIVFISDNGFMWGEHRLIDLKNILYEEAARVPFLVRYPPLVPVPRLDERLVANIDLAPTIYELAGLPIPSEVDGRSLVPLLQGGAPLRDHLLLEAWKDASSSPWLGIRTEQHVYIERAGDRSELYDMIADPYQLQNVADDPAYAGVLADLQAKLSLY